MIKTFFDHLNSVSKEQLPNYWNIINEQDKKTWSTYMLNRYLSMDSKLTVLIDILQKYNNSLSNELSYKLYIGILPKSNKFLRYVKKDEKSKYSADDINKIATYYMCSNSEAKEYVKILSSDQIKNILGLFNQSHKITKRK